MTDVNIWSSALSDDQMIRFTSKCESQVRKANWKIVICFLTHYTLKALMSSLWDETFLITIPNDNNNQ